MRGARAADVESDDPRDALRTMTALGGLHCDTRVVDLRRARPANGTASHAELVAQWAAEWLVGHLSYERTWRARQLVK